MSANLSTNLIPPTSNTFLSAPGAGNLLYNDTLLFVCSGLAQHGIIFGLIFLARGFSSARVFELHYLTLLLGLTYVFAPLVFVIDKNIDALKIFFFLEHESAEYLIAAVVFLPVSISKRHPGSVLLCFWCGLTVLTTMVSLNDFYHHGLEVVAWNAFCSDFLIGITGVYLMWIWLKPRNNRNEDYLTRVTRRAEGMAGISFASHGFITMSIGPITTGIIYDNLNPAWFPYAWALIFGAAMVGVGLFVPTILLLFDTIQWNCCSHRRPIKRADQITMGSQDTRFEEHQQKNSAYTAQITTGSTTGSEDAARTIHGDDLV